MAVPKRKTSKARRDKRRNNLWKLTAPTLVRCSDCGAYKRPHRIIFAKVPRNPTGKIEKPKLREIYCGESLVASQNEINK